MSEAALQRAPPLVSPAFGTLLSESFFTWIARFP
jgi:hypothetical protein